MTLVYYVKIIYANKSIFYIIKVVYILSIKSKLNKKFKPHDSHGNIKFTTTDYILNSLAIFHLKYKSLLQLNKDKKDKNKFKTDISQHF